MAVPSRCAPQSTLQYHHLPSSVEYSPYPHQSTSVDWRPPYAGHAGPYSPYPDDDESSPLLSQPPSYMLPNTDPMSANNTYYMHGVGVRPQPSSLWSEPQQYISQTTTQPTGLPYTMPHDTSQSFQTMGPIGALASDRILPQPITARSYMPAPASSIDIHMPTPSQRTHSYWHSDTGTSVHQLPTPVEASPSQEHGSERASLPYRIQDMRYGQVNLGEGLSGTTASSSSYLAMTDPQPSTAVSSLGGSSSQSILGLITSENQKHNTEGTAATYSYPSSLSGRTPPVRSASNHLRPGPLYCQTTTLPRRDLGSDDYSPECTSCQTESTRTSFTSIMSTSAGC